MKYLLTNSTDCYYNMAFEEYAFENLDPAESYVSLWRNNNTVVVGRYQNTAAELNETYASEHNVSVVRRLSGGGAVYHDLGNLNYTFIAESDAGQVKADFARFTKPVVEALSTLGVNAELSGRNDLTIDGKKFSGNAQYSKNGRTMHHGTLMFASDLNVISEVLKPPGAKFESKGVKSVRSRVANIGEFTSATMDDFKAALLTSLNAEPLTLTSTQLGEIQELRDTKYALREWNYGKSPPYTMRVEQRFPFGGIEVRLDVENDKIQSVSILGDFFGAPDISGAENTLIGAAPTIDGISKALSRVDISEFIYGLDNEQFINIFR
ncbi:MAG: lipoate--protein ligase [Oscillospiraceae bacterium]|jgi:lipoate-protein ligase A|nr:lipoate--protein ligase [Oscillospiraceae bacterium]